MLRIVRLGLVVSICSLPLAGQAAGPRGASQDAHSDRFTPTVVSLTESAQPILRGVAAWFSPPVPAASAYYECRAAGHEEPVCRLADATGAEPEAVRCAQRCQGGSAATKAACMSRCDGDWPPSR